MQRLGSVAALLLVGPVGLCSAVDHPCEAEVQSACPDRPGADIAACLKDPSEHERPTEVSSECTDFIALNKACAPELVEFCDEAFFTRDTALCLSVWTDQDSLSKKCAGVVAWAVPKSEDAVEVTDELGLSKKDYEEKRKWQAERKQARQASVEKAREEQNDLKARIRLDGEDETAYKERLRELDELEKSRQQVKKQERLQAAAKEREWRKEQGLPEVETAEELNKKERRRKRTVKPEDESNTLFYVLGGLFVAYIFFNILNFFTGGAEKKDE